MEMLLFERKEFARLYNCSFYDVDLVPFEQRQHVGHGVTFVALFVLFEILYIPCLYEMLTSRARAEPCYKLMIQLGVADVLLMSISGLFCGVMSLEGWVYCSCPMFNMVVCTIGMFLWGIESSTSLILALNRCCAMYDGRGVAVALFGGRKIFFWIGFSLLYGVIGATASKPILFSSIYMAAFFNPHMGYFEDTEQVYTNPFHTLNNFTVLLGLTGIYLVFFIFLFYRKTKYGTSVNVMKMKREIRLSLQIAIISLLYATTSFIYFYMQFFKASQLVILIGSYTLLLVQGAPAVIYVFMNNTIRDGIQRKMCGDRRTTPFTMTLHSSNNYCNYSKHNYDATVT